MLQNNKKSRYSIIIGCGYLGKTLLKKLRQAGDSVSVTTRTKENLARLKESGADAYVFDVNNPDSWDSLFNREKVECDLFFLVPPSQVESNSFKKLVAHLIELPLHRAILASSTVVYGNKERKVDADSESDIDSVRGERQHHIEQLWQNLGEKTRIVRFAGLYGTERVLGKSSVLNSGQISGLSEAWLNLVHVSDAAKLLAKIRDSEAAGKVELGCDGRPVLRQQYYSDLAKHLNCPPPVFSEDKNKKGRGRRCCNRITIDRTGWKPEVMDYKDSF